MNSNAKPIGKPNLSSAKIKPFKKPPGNPPLKNQVSKSNIKPMKKPLASLPISKPSMMMKNSVPSKPIGPPKNIENKPIGKPPISNHSQTNKNQSNENAFISAIKDKVESWNISFDFLDPVFTWMKENKFATWLKQAAFWGWMGNNALIMKN